MSSKSFSLVILTSALSAACTTPPIVPIPTTPNIPPNWGTYGDDFWEGTQCPKVEGVYHNPPTVYVVDEERSDFRDGKDYIFYSLFAFYVADETLESHTPGVDKPHTLTFVQESSDTFSIAYTANEIQKLVEYQYHRDDGDFECVDGFIQFPTSAHFGMVEGMSLNGQEVNRFAVTVSGDLIAIKAQGPYRSRRTSAGSKFVHEFYLFKRLQASE